MLSLIGALKLDAIGQALSHLKHNSLKAEQKECPRRIVCLRQGVEGKICTKGAENGHQLTNWSSQECCDKSKWKFLWQIFPRRMDSVTIYLTRCLIESSNMSLAKFEAEWKILARFFALISQFPWPIEWWAFPTCSLFQRSVFSREYLVKQKTECMAPNCKERPQRYNRQVSAKLALISFINPSDLYQLKLAIQAL